MHEKEILDGGTDALIQDDMDRMIMEALTDGLSDITVSEALCGRTVLAVKKREEAKRERLRFRRIWGGLFTAAAALFVVVLGSGMFRMGKKAQMESGEGMLSGGAQNSIQNVQQGVDKTVGWDFGSADGWGISGGDGGKAPVSAEPPGAGMDSAPAESPEANMSAPSDFFDGADGVFSETEMASRKEWLYEELLASFDADGGDEMPLPGMSAEEDGEKEAKRSILWQSGERELSCVIYEKDYRIVATLREGESLRRIELKDWIYAGQLWELAAE